MISRTSTCGAACTGSVGAPTGSTGAWTASTGSAARGVTYTGGATVVGPMVTTRGAAACTGSTGAPTGSTGTWTRSTGRGVAYTGSEWLRWSVFKYIGGATVVGPMVVTTAGAAACTGSTGAPTGSAGNWTRSTG